MRPGFLNTCLASLYFLIASAASPRDKYREASDHLPEVVKSVTQDLSKEPSCDELRAMWRFSKRQSRAAESTNEIPTYRDPFAYNVWEDHASIRSVGGGKMRRPLVYGRLVHNGYQRPRIQEAPPERVRGFEDIARMFGTVHMPKAHSRRKPTSIRLVGGNGLGQMQMNNAQTGSFQHLKELIQSERARELHEQKMSEESAARESALQYRRMMIQDSTGLVPYSHGRSRSHLDPVVNFPDVLAPSNDYYTNNYNYMQRSSYPDSLVLPRADRIFVGSVSKRQFLDTEGSFGSSPRPLPPLLLSPAFGYSQGNTLNLKNPETPSVIDQEITRLKADDVLHQIGIIGFPHLAKRTMFYAVPQEYLEGEPAPVEQAQAFSPVMVYPLPGYLIRDPQETPLLAAADGYEPINVDGPSSYADADLELMTAPDFTYETIAYDSESNGISNHEISSECVRVFDDVKQCLERENVSDLDEEFYLGNSSLKEKQQTIDSSEENENSNRPTMKERKIKSSYDNQVGKGDKLDRKMEPREDISFARNDRKRPLISKKSSEEINRESKIQENSKEEEVTMKPRMNIQSFAWPPWSQKYEYSGSALADVQKTAVLVGDKTLINPRLFHSVYIGKEQKVRGNDVKGMQVGGKKEVEPSNPPVN